MWVTYGVGISVRTLTHKPAQMAHYVSRPEVQQHPSSLETARFPGGPFLFKPGAACHGRSAL